MPSFRHTVCKPIGDYCRQHNRHNNDDDDDDDDDNNDDNDDDNNDDNDDHNVNFPRPEARKLRPRVSGWRRPTRHAVQNRPEQHQSLVLQDGRCRVLYLR